MNTPSHSADDNPEPGGKTGSTESAADAEPSDVVRQVPLPARPDPATCEPFPPAASGYRGPDLAHAGSIPKHVVPPHDEGPAFVQYRESRAAGLRHYAIFLIVVTALFAIMSLLSGDGLSMLTYWPITALIVTTPYLMTSPLSYRTVSVGADWFAWTLNKRWWTPWMPQPHHVKTYELTKIVGYTPTWSHPHLMLRDADGREVDAAITLFQGDRRAWDLLASGVLHSVASGATISHDAVNIFQIADHPVLVGAQVV